MVSRKNLIYGVVGLLVVVGIILAVLGGMGYLTPKHLTDLPPGVPSLNIANAVVTITDFDQTTGTVKYTVNNPDKEYAHSQPLGVLIKCLNNCPSSANNEIWEPIDINRNSGSYSYTSDSFIFPTGTSTNPNSMPRAYIWVGNGYSNVYYKQLQ